MENSCGWAWQPDNRRLVDLEPEKFAARMYHSAAAREYASDPAAYVKAQSRTALSTTIW